MTTYNWRPDPSRLAFFDWETWSERPLKSKQRYIDKSVVLCSALRIDGITHLNPSYEMLAQVSRDRIMVAHNAPFDSAVWEHQGLPDATWCDTLPMTRAAGLPGGLDALGQRLFGRGKDITGKRVLDMFIKAKTLPPRTLPIYSILEAYCARDVELLEQAFPYVANQGEVDVMTVDRAMNQRGVPVNRQYLQSLHDIMEANSEEAEKRLVGVFNPRSPLQVKKWLNARGYNVDSCSAEVLKDLTLSDDDDAIMSDRQEVTRVGLSKAKEGLLSLDDDDRLRDQFAYWASLPGRWASYGLQLHNMPKAKVDARGVAMNPTSVATAAAEMNCRVSDITNGALRHCIQHPNLMVADFAAVEPRMLAWLADDQEALAVYRDPRRSMYLEMGRKVFGRVITKADEVEYFISKQLVIGCGYGMGKHKFALTLEKFGVDSPIDPGELVKTYRKASPKVVMLWKAYDDAVMNAVKYGAESKVGPVQFFMDNDTLIIRLPSGRCIPYRQAHIELRVPVYKHLYGMPLTPEPTVCYMHPRFGVRELYGGKVTENVDQAACRDLLAHVMCELEYRDFEPCMHAHDEVGALKGSFPDFMRVCSTPPQYAHDFPLVAEGYQGPMWAKDSSGYVQAKYQQGRPI